MATLRLRKSGKPKVRKVRPAVGGAMKKRKNNRTQRKG